MCDVPLLAVDQKLFLLIVSMVCCVSPSILAWCDKCSWFRSLVSLAVRGSQGEEEVVSVVNISWLGQDRNPWQSPAADFSVPAGAAGSGVTSLLWPGVTTTRTVPQIHSAVSSYRIFLLCTDHRHHHHHHSHNIDTQYM